MGENYCLSPQVECPRLVGEGYEKCKTICNQLGHAEEIALMKALEARVDLKNASVVIGHSHACDNCDSLLTKYGVGEIKFLGDNYD